MRIADGAGVDVDVSLGGNARPLPPAVDLTAYRIVQESLTNVVRHAGASRARVRIDYERDGIELRIEDDGRGRANGFRVRARLPTRPAS